MYYICGGDRLIYKPGKRCNGVCWDLCNTLGFFFVISSVSPRADFILGVKSLSLPPLTEVYSYAPEVVNMGTMHHNVGT